MNPSSSFHPRRLVLAAVAAVSSTARLASTAATLLACSASSVFAQAAPARPSPVVEKTTVKATDETVVLTPFQVVSDDRGYQAFNTLSGTRLNSKLEDLGSSITVVTKQQLIDTAAIDINNQARGSTRWLLQWSRRGRQYVCAHQQPAG